MRTLSVVRPLLASARLIGLGGAISAFVLWIVFFVGSFRVLGEDFGITTGTLVQAALMAALAIVAAWASLRLVAPVLIVVSVVSFVPVGFYLMLLSGYLWWIGVCNLLCLAAGLIMAVGLRLARPARREVAG